MIYQIYFIKIFVSFFDMRTRVQGSARNNDLNGFVLRMV